MYNNQSDYEKRGVSSDKGDVHKAIQHVDKGIFPKAFCKILPDLFGNDKKFCSIIHADGAGTKTSLAYIYWKETGDLSVWKGVAQDSAVMNLDDLICTGATKVPLILSGTIGRNKYLIPGEVISTIINGTEEFLQKMRDLGINIQSGGGETADVGDLVRTIIIDNTITCRMPREKVISIEIQPGDVIVGLASFGQASYESHYNSGMGSNGLTNSRHDMFSKEYIEKYPESFDPILLKECPELVYRGNNEILYKIPNDIWNNSPYHKPLNVGKLVLSPTRTYAPIIQQVVNNFKPGRIHGIIHCSGGGQTKVMNHINDVHIIKNNLFNLPPVFQMIKENYANHLQEMYKSFNMGHRMEIYVPSEKDASLIIEIAKSFNVEAQIIGHVEAATEKKLTIKSELGEFTY